jgi:hypothetical protein
MARQASAIMSPMRSHLKSEKALKKYCRVVGAELFFDGSLLVFFGDVQKSSHEYLNAMNALE